MDIQLEKYKLMEWLVNIKDEGLITKLKTIQDDSFTNQDWNNEISEVEKQAVEKGLSQIEEGNVLSHQAVIKSIADEYDL
jgi:hypothetical protein